MNKLFKRMAIAIALAAAVICLVAFAACDNASDNGNSYNVTVVYQDGSPVNGKTGTSGQNGDTVYVQICDADDVSRCYSLVELGEDGKISVDASALETAIPNANNFYVHLKGLPAGYTYSDDYIISTTSRSVTITIYAE